MAHSKFNILQGFLDIDTLWGMRIPYISQITNVDTFSSIQDFRNDKLDFLSCNNIFSV